MEVAEQPSDLARVHVFVWCKGISGEPQFLSHITVREAVQSVFPRKEHLKSTRSLRDRGLKALTVLPSLVGALVVNASRSRTAGVGSCTWIKASRYLTLLWGRDLSGSVEV